MTIAATLAQMVTRTTYDELPSLAVDHAAMMISSTIASAAAGYSIASSEIIRALAKEQGGTPEASIWFDSSVKLPAVNVCRVNAVASDAAASDDSDLRNIVHLGTQLTASTLALGERSGASGKEVLAAMVLGCEIAGRIGESLMPGYRNLGFHGCIVATFGAAVASGRMLKLNQQQMAQTIAIAAVSMGGLATAADTSVAREYFAGNAALMGVNAALAAQKGYLAEESILETKKGFFEVYGGEDIESVTRDWGKSWDIVTDMAIKLVPGGHPNHTLAEAATKAAREGNVSADEVETITIARPLSRKLRVGLPSPSSHPKNLVDVAHTPAYFAAAAVADKDFSWTHAAEKKIFDPVIHQLIDKVRIGDPVTQDIEKFRHGAVVTIKTKDGRSYTSTVYTPKGSGARGIAWADVDNKYRTLVAVTNLSPQKIEDSIKLMHEFRDVHQVSKLTSLLR
ncbi:MAG TPA: MmgE/PrpD family protein [Burkholderiales bacterium]|nr:MmgE/PrpD family protein [Burkholderiales bacterium]